MNRDDLLKHIGQTAVYIEHLGGYSCYASWGTLVKVNERKAYIKWHGLMGDEKRFVWLDNIVFCGGNNSCKAVLADLDLIFKATEKDIQQALETRKNKMKELLAQYNNQP
jgi:hypothetical protein